MLGIGNCNFIVNEEFLVSISHQLVLIMSLPFVHTARRYYWLGVQVRCLAPCLHGSILCGERKKFQAWVSRGSKSRNKVSVGEPAEGSVTHLIYLLVGLRLEGSRWITKMEHYSSFAMSGLAAHGFAILPFLSMRFPFIAQCWQIQLSTWDHLGNALKKNNSTCVIFLRIVIPCISFSNASCNIALRSFVVHYSAWLQYCQQNAASTEMSFLGAVGLMGEYLIIQICQI